MRLLTLEATWILTLNLGILTRLPKKEKIHNSEPNILSLFKMRSNITLVIIHQLDKYYIYGMRPRVISPLPLLKVNPLLHFPPSNQWCCKACFLHKELFQPNLWSQIPTNLLLKLFLVILPFTMSSRLPLIFTFKLNSIPMIHLLIPHLMGRITTYLLPLFPCKFYDIILR